MTATNKKTVWVVEYREIEAVDNCVAHIASTKSKAIQFILDNPNFSTIETKWYWWLAEYNVDSNDTVFPFDFSTYVSRNGFESKELWQVLNNNTPKKVKNAE